MGRGLDRAGLDRWLDGLDQRQREYLGLSATDTGGSAWAEGLHPDDQAGLDAAWRAAASAGEPGTVEGRWRLADGEYRWSRLRGVPVESGAITRWYGVKTDVDDLKREEERLRRDALELRLFVDFVPQNIAVLAPDGRIVRINRSGLEYLGLTLEQVVQADNLRSTIYHPDDLAVVGPVHRDGFSRGVAFEIEARIRRHDGQFRWFLLRYEPFRDTDGRIMRWYLAGTDIEERKHLEDRMREENIALREEIDQASMFEQIVGASTPLRSLLSHVVKVAPTESTVLITGETGTGKELVARAIHKRSRRAQRVFVSVNCAAIPPALIASELFGHEKGAFTGAVQRRTGRFELAEGGTLFLDEVGDLPAETQTTLLRVLQEREFERVGGSRAIPTDVRVIAATNRNLKAAIADGTFRSDLYYRLNVFPVALPSLRERKDDIPLLVQYFVDRYSRNAGARIRAVSKRSLALLQSYPWPGNIRELQNVIERAVIICDTDTLQVDESWLLGESRDVNRSEQSLVDHLGGEERAAIEAALTETRGKVSGPSGAAAKLRMPSTTLESRIKSLGIDKSRFKRVY